MEDGPGFTKSFLNAVLRMIDANVKAAFIAFRKFAGQSLGLSGRLILIGNWLQLLIACKNQATVSGHNE
jgi:hypothetical protein